MKKEHTDKLNNKNWGDPGIGWKEIGYRTDRERSVICQNMLPCRIRSGTQDSAAQHFSADNKYLCKPPAKCALASFSGCILPLHS